VLGIYGKNRLCEVHNRLEGRVLWPLDMHDLIHGRIVKMLDPYDGREHAKILETENGRYWEVFAFTGVSFPPTGEPAEFKGRKLLPAPVFIVMEVALLRKNGH